VNTPEPKGRNVTAERRFEPNLRTECQFSNAGMQPVGTDDEIEPLLLSVGERRGDTVAILFEVRDRDTKVGWDAVAGLEEGSGELRPCDADEAGH
jgi:hypothetical protein